MTAILAQHTGARCPICKDIIRKGEPIVCSSDRWIHAECEPDFSPWGDEPTHTPPPVHELLKILLEHGSLRETVMEKDYDPFELPESVRVMLFAYFIAEENLWNLLRDLASEHAIAKGGGA